MMFDKARQLANLKRQSDALKNEMERIIVTFEEKGVRVVVRGDQRLEQLVVNGEEMPRIKEAVNKALKESQKKVAKKMRGQLMDLGLPGL